MKSDVAECKTLNRRVIPLSLALGQGKICKVDPSFLVYVRTIEKEIKIFIANKSLTYAYTIKVIVIVKRMYVESRRS